MRKLREHWKNGFIVMKNFFLFVQNVKARWFFWISCSFVEQMNAIWRVFRFVCLFCISIIYIFLYSFLHSYVIHLQWTIGKYAPRFNGFQQHDAQVIWYLLPVYLIWIYYHFEFSFLWMTDRRTFFWWMPHFVSFVRL